MSSGGKRFFIAMWLVCIAIALVACDDASYSDLNTKDETETTRSIPDEKTSIMLSVPVSEDECIGKDREEIKEIFKNAGFENIEFVSSDLEESEKELYKYGEVISITWGEMPIDFMALEKGQLIESDSTIFIFYAEGTKVVVDGENEFTYSVSEITGTMYATRSVNIRSIPSTDGEKLGSLSENQSIDVTGKCDNGWYRVLYNGMEAFVFANYLAADKKEIAQEAIVVEQPVVEELPVVQPEQPIVEELPVVQPEQPVADSSGSSNGGNGTGVVVPGYEDTVGNLVWVPTNGGKKYHSKSSCSNMDNPMQVTVEHAESNGYTPCKRCH